MTDWKEYKNLGPFKIEKSTADLRYNVGDAIVDGRNPVWSIHEKVGNPITPTHTPCGYWNGILDIVDLFARITSRPYPVEGVDETESKGCIIISVNYTNQTYYIPSEASESYGTGLISGNLGQSFFLIGYLMATEASESYGVSLLSGSLGIAFILVQYNISPEAAESYGVNLIGGNLGIVLIIVNYNIVHEATESYGTSLIGGSLE